MAETISRTLRDGALDGEHAPCLTIKENLQIQLGFEAFIHFVFNLGLNISAGKSQAQGLVLVSLERSPSCYLDLLKSGGLDATSFSTWLQIVDVYSDPLGWKDLLPSVQKYSSLDVGITSFKDVKDMDKLFTTIIDVGRGIVGQSKSRFSVAIDSISALLRHASLPSVSGFMSNLRSHGQVSSSLSLIHSDLHEPRVILAVEYISSMIANLEPLTAPSDTQQSTSHNSIWSAQTSYRGKFNTRLKRRNGRVKIIVEEFLVEQTGMKFVAQTNDTIDQSLLPKVQFNLQLSEKEQLDRAKVVLPFEHQGNGKKIQIYDGRRSLSEGQNDPYSTKSTPSTGKLAKETDIGGGEIHYLRDSDDERFDSDEDPDDDLDI